MTDEARDYKELGRESAEHGAVNHARTNTRAARSPPTALRATTASSSVGMKAVYQHCAEKHLHRYLSGFDVR
jgi:hypothetical protein